MIFENARDLLDHIPENLKPAASKDHKQWIRVSTASKDMSACFIDIKVFGNWKDIESLTFYKKFYQKMIKLGIKPNSRPTIGLYHLNWNVVAFEDTVEAKSIRITPGINREENLAVLQFLQDLSDIAS